jgi:hypothetical protein
MYHYNYILLHPETKQYYIGKHSTKNLNDGYMGSGAWPRQMIKENIELIKVITDFCESSEEAYINEKALIGDKWQNDLNCMNRVAGGVNGIFSYFESGDYVKHCMDKWQVSHHMKSKKFLEESNFKFPFCDPEIQKIINNTLIRKYGGRGSASKIIKSRVESTNIERYGETHTLNLDVVKNARESAVLEKFGTDNPFKNPIKMSEVLLERYGVSNMMFDANVKAKHHKIMCEKDWTERDAKTKATILNKYNGVLPINTPEFREKHSLACPFGCKDKHKFNVGCFSIHMIKIHGWNKTQVKEFKNAK